MPSSPERSCWYKPTLWVVFGIVSPQHKKQILQKCNLQLSSAVSRIAFPCSLKANNQLDLTQQLDQ